MCCREVEWGGGAAPALSQLTELSLYSGALRNEQEYPGELCSLPALRSIHVVRRRWAGGGRPYDLHLHLPPAFTALTALESIASTMPLSEEAAKLVGGVVLLSTG